MSADLTPSMSAQAAAPSTPRPAPDTPADRWLAALALQAAVYAWPLVEMRRLRATTTPRRTDAEGPAGDTPDSPLRWVNALQHTRALLRAGQSRVVLPNNDTLYTNAWLDLADGPLALELPDMGERYHVFGFLDAYTNPFAHVGTRTIGNGGGRVLITPPGWSGPVPAEFAAPGRHLRAPTRWLWLIARILVDGEADVPAVAALQARFRLLACDAQGRPVERPPARRWQPVGATRPPASAQAFLREANAMLAENPPPADEAALLDTLRAVGLALDDAALAALFARPGIQAAWDGALAEAARLLDAGGLPAAHTAQHAPPDHWSLGSLVPGESFGHDWLARAVTARQAIGALCPAEAIYPRCFADADGHPLTGAHGYVLRFEPGRLPPVDAFWSITLYGAQDYHFVDNPIDRYAIGDRTPGLQPDADGGLTIHLRHEAPPDAAARANWLPAPAGEFLLCLRAYLPTPAWSTGAYRLPAPVRID